MKVSIIGAGAWGTALSILARKQNHEVRLWARRKEIVQQILSEQCVPYLKGVRLPTDIAATPDLAKAVAGADLVMIAVPSHGVRAVAQKLAPLIGNLPILSVTKGIETETHLRMSQVIRETIGENDYAVLSGPSFAHDVAGGKPTAVVVASESAGRGEWIQKNFSGSTFRLYTSSDVTGVELGGAMKNIMAIAAGVGDGLGLGESTRAALITRALSELVRLGERLGGRHETFFGLSGLGDLVLTCGGQQSRNHRVGERLARGESLEQIVLSMNGVAEGVRNTQSFHQLAIQSGMDAPIIGATYGILYEGVTPTKAIENLMGRELKKE